MMRYRPGLAVVIGGGIAASLDIVYAVLRNGGNGRTPLWTLQSVASGWLGKDAFDKGLGSGILGLLSHFAILFVAAAIYVAAGRRIPALHRNAWLCGAIFGIGVYCFMNFALLPVTAFPFKLSYPPLRLLEGFASHAVFVGLPIALAARRWAQSA